MMPRTKKKKISRKIEIITVTESEFYTHLNRDFSQKYVNDIMTFLDTHTVIEYRYGCRPGSSRNVLQVVLSTGGVKTWYSRNKKVFF